MTLCYFLDTNILSEAIKPQPSLSVLENTNRHKSELSTASVVVHELLFGCLRLHLEAKCRTDLQNYLDQVILAGLPIFPYDTDAACLTVQGKLPPLPMGKLPPLLK